MKPRACLLPPTSVWPLRVHIFKEKCKDSIFKYPKLPFLLENLSWWPTKSLKCVASMRFLFHELMLDRSKMMKENDIAMIPLHKLGKLKYFTNLDLPEIRPFAGRGGSPTTLPFGVRSCEVLLTSNLLVGSNPPGSPVTGGSLTKFSKNEIPNPLTFMNATRITRILGGQCVDLINPTSATSRNLANVARRGSKVHKGVNPKIWENPPNHRF